MSRGISEPILNICNLFNTRTNDLYISIYIASIFLFHFNKNLLDQHCFFQLKRTYGINDSEALAGRRAVASEQRMRSNETSCAPLSNANEKQNKKLKLQKNAKSRTQKSIDGNYINLLADWLEFITYVIHHLVFLLL